MVVACVPVIAAAQVRDSIISVSTSRSIRLAPDRASLFVTVEGTAETTPDAQARVDSKLSAVLAALRALGPSVEIERPVPIGAGPTGRNYSPPQQSRLLIARSAVRVQVRDLSVLPALYAAATEAGAVGTSPPLFEASGADSARRREYTTSIETMRADAEGVARALGGRIVGIVEVMLNESGAVFRQPTMLPVEAYSQPALAPEVILGVNVTVRFRMAR